MITRHALIRRAAAQAGDLLARYFRQDLDIRKKGELDLVTEADENAERLVRDLIIAHFPHDAILAEELAAREGDSGYRWIIDPLDGTTNFTHGLPQWSVSIALAKDDEIVEGVVFDPIKSEIFHARRGEGATCNDLPLACGSTERLADALCVSGFSYDRRERIDELMTRVRRALMTTRGFRRHGSAALDLCYVAAGRFDLYWEDGLNPWDMAAGALIAAEAGASVETMYGAPFNPYGNGVLACVPALRDAALREIIGDPPA